ncbi:hypothetical protein RN001_007845 [Aquatica leii]|uniref:Adenylate cyclase N-terminal domain-containing protein n=1 Tax=Aquatica leii TaxID=1421715 RepID=A0AAN7P9G7_9COLE|nr:hypothetical protein RN001_007845 [Aquatica leii]
MPNEIPFAVIIPQSLQDSIDTLNDKIIRKYEEKIVNLETENQKLVLKLDDLEQYSRRSLIKCYVYLKHTSNCILLLTANLLGLTSYFVEDKQQRRAFLETRQSLEVKLVIEEQSDEQERLLLSVLPEHVAVQMRQDLDLTDSQFKKIYMSRHENEPITNDHIDDDASIQSNDEPYQSSCSEYVPSSYSSSHEGDEDDYANLRKELILANSTLCDESSTKMLSNLPVFPLELACQLQEVPKSMKSPVFPLQICDKFQIPDNSSDSKIETTAYVNRAKKTISTFDGVKLTFFEYCCIRKVVIEEELEIAYNDDDMVEKIFIEPPEVSVLTNIDSAEETIEVH